MRFPILFLTLLAISSLTPAAGADPLTGESLEIGSGNSIFGPTTYLGAAIGDNNSVNVDGNCALFLGYGNSLQYAWTSLTIGDQNQGYLDNSICLGYSNYNTGGIYSLLLGDWNTGGTYGGIIAGHYNAITGSAQFAFGMGLINVDTEVPAVFIGQFNKNVSSPEPPPLLTVGNGTGPAANQRSNAFEIYLDGTIKMRPQGDISMGAFAP